MNHCGEYWRTNHGFSFLGLWMLPRRENIGIQYPQCRGREKGINAWLVVALELEEMHILCDEAQH